MTFFLQFSKCLFYIKAKLSFLPFILSSIKISIIPKIVLFSLSANSFNFFMEFFFYSNRSKFFSTHIGFLYLYFSNPLAYFELKLIHIYLLLMLHIERINLLHKNFHLLQLHKVWKFLGLYELTLQLLLLHLQFYWYLSNPSISHFCLLYLYVLYTNLKKSL